MMSLLTDLMESGPAIFVLIVLPFVLLWFAVHHRTNVEPAERHANAKRRSGVGKDTSVRSSAPKGLDEREHLDVGPFGRVRPEHIEDPMVTISETVSRGGPVALQFVIEPDWEKKREYLRQNESILLHPMRTMMVFLYLAEATTKSSPAGTSKKVIRLSSYHLELLGRCYRFGVEHTFADPAERAFFELAYSKFSRG